MPRCHLGCLNAWGSSTGSTEIMYLSLGVAYEPLQMVAVSLPSSTIISSHFFDFSQSGRYAVSLWF